MRLHLDLSSAGVTRGHSYAGVVARVDGGPPTTVIVDHDGCRLDDGGEEKVACDSFHIDNEQAWAVAMLLLGRPSLRPSGPGFLGADGTTLSFDLVDGRRGPIMDDRPPTAS